MDVLVSLRQQFEAVGTVFSRIRRGEGEAGRLLELGGACVIQLAVTALVDQGGQIGQITLEQVLGLYQFGFHECDRRGADRIGEEGVELGMHLVTQAVHTVLNGD